MSAYWSVVIVESIICQSKISTFEKSECKILISKIFWIGKNCNKLKLSCNGVHHNEAERYFQLEEI